MFFVNTLRGLGRPSAERRKGPQRSADRSRLTRQLSVERLEDRMLLSYSFTLIADNTGDISGFPFVPAINRDGTVVLNAVYQSGQQAILTGDGGDLTTVVATGDLFSNLDGTPTINDSGAVAHRGTLTAGGKMVFTARDGKVIPIARTSDGVFADFPAAIEIHEEGTVHFRATLTAGGEGIFQGDATQIA